MYQIAKIVYTIFMKSSFKIVLALAFVAVFFIPTKAFAAYEASERTISGSIDIYPENRPVAHAPLQLVLELKDSAKKFQLKNCDCELSITQPGRLPYTQKVTVPNFRAPDTNTTVIYYSFPSPATYSLVLKGKPTDKTSFQPFSLTWNMPISGKFVETPKAKHPRINIFIYLGIAIIVIAALFGVRYYLKKRKSSPAPQKET